MSEDVEVSQVNRLIQEELRQNPASFNFAQLDSLMVIKMILGLEKTFGIKLDVSELHESNFGTTDALIAYVRRKKSNETG